VAQQWWRRVRACAVARDCDLAAAWGVLEDEEGGLVLLVVADVAIVSAAEVLVRESSVPPQGILAASSTGIALRGLISWTYCWSCTGKW
jgi:hypothetical protein